MGSPLQSRGMVQRASSSSSATTGGPGGGSGNGGGRDGGGGGGGGPGGEGAGKGSVLSLLWGMYMSSLERRPLTTKVITTAILNGVGDAICQFMYRCAVPARSAIVPTSRIPPCRRRAVSRSRLRSLPTFVCAQRWRFLRLAAPGAFRFPRWRPSGSCTPHLVWHAWEARQGQRRTGSSAEVSIKLAARIGMV